MSGFVDLHIHFVYGVDDGAQTREEMFAMLDAAHADSVSTLVATSHVSPGIRPFPQERYERHLEEARCYCQEKGYPLVLLPGAEILYTPAIEYAMLEQMLPTLGSTNWILLEFVPDVTLREIEQALGRAAHCGYRVVVAHIERYPCLFHGARLRTLRQQYPIRCQVNCSTVLSGCGFWNTRTLWRWFREGLVDCIASDAHNVTTRRTQLRAAHEALALRCGAAEADRLMQGCQIFSAVAAESDEDAVNVAGE